MPSVHFLNVGEGDCTIIQHGSTRCTVVDICAGNTTGNMLLKTLLEIAGNFRRCDYPTNPIDYLRSIGVTSVFRFIPTHPEMDHLDGFNALVDAFNIVNMWDSGVRREKPPFNGGKYKEVDWDRFVGIRDGQKDGTNTVRAHAGDRFKFANETTKNPGDFDALYILAPSEELVNAANEDGDVNDASFVILYCTTAGKILMPGDAHDATWKYVLDNYEAAVKDCKVLMAPHHGRHSNRSFDFLDVVKPRVTLFGCAPSEHLAYDAWNKRNLYKITNNQAGDIILDIVDKHINVYVENPHFVKAERRDVSNKNAQVQTFLGYID